MGRRVRLAQRRKSVGCSQEQLADRLGIDRSTVARWEAGDTEPQPWLRPKLARILQVSLDHLDTLLEEAAIAATTDEDRLGYVVRHPDAVDMAAVLQLRDRLDVLDDRYDAEPSTALLADAGSCLGTVALLRESARGGRLRRELLAVEADAAILMGQLVWDASQRRDHAGARTHYQRAAQAARQLGHPAVEARATLRTCYLALYGEDQPRTGLTLADRAGELAGTTSPVLAGLAALHAAEAHARLGQGDDCDARLTEAEDHLGKITKDDAAYELVTPAHYGRLAGSCYLSLGRHDEAEQVLAATARQIRPTSKSRAIVLGNLALARLQQHDLDGAVAAAHEAIDVLELTWGGGGLSIVFSAARQMKPWAHTPAVSDVRERLLSLIAAH